MEFQHKQKDKAVTLPGTGTGRFQALMFHILTVILFAAPQVTDGGTCHTLQVSGAFFYEEVNGIYRKVASNYYCQGHKDLPNYQQGTSDAYGHVHYVYYARKTGWVTGGWAISELMCDQYEGAKVASENESDDVSSPLDVELWYERMYNGWMGSNKLRLECIDDNNGLSNAAIASMSVCLVLFVILVITLIFTIYRCRKRRQLRQRWRHQVPSVSYEVSNQQVATSARDDLPPAYSSLQELDKHSPPSYHEVMENPNYVQIHSPVTKDGISNAAFVHENAIDMNSPGTERQRQQDVLETTI